MANDWELGITQNAGGVWDNSGPLRKTAIVGGGVLLGSWLLNRLTGVDTVFHTSDRDGICDLDRYRRRNKKEESKSASPPSYSAAPSTEPPKTITIGGEDCEFVGWDADGRPCYKKS